MRYLPSYILLLLFLSSIFNAEIHAQTLDVDWKDLYDVRLENTWLQVENTAGLITFDEETKSELILSGQMKYGDLKNYFSSNEELFFDIQASSLSRLSNRVVVQGDVGYRNLVKKNIAGSYFIDPQQTPFDLLEYTDENSGNKRLEEYYLQGDIAVSVWKSLACGSSFRYTTANYSKFKDLRHANSLMDMTFVFGMSASISKKLTVGINYSYRRRNETLLLSSYGKQDEVFVSLLSYGMFFGKQETFGEVGYTKENENKPLFDMYNGISMQLSWQLNDKLEWLNEFTYKKRSGFYGEPSYNTVIYSEHEGLDFVYKSILTCLNNNDSYSFSLSLQANEVSNAENIYMYRTEESGRYYVDYLGKRDVAFRNNRSVNIFYRGRHNIHKGLAKWTSSVNTSLNSLYTKASNYPEYREQNITYWNVSLTIGRNFLSRLNHYSITINTYYGDGIGDAYKDDSYIQMTEEETLTRTRNDLLLKEWEFLTCTQLGSGFDFVYTRVINTEGLRISAGINYLFVKALDNIYIDNAMRNIITLKLSTKF